MSRPRSKMEYLLKRNIKEKKEALPERAGITGGPLQRTGCGACEPDFT